jgi:hypothetical protein
MIYYPAVRFRITKFMDENKFKEELSKVALWYTPVYTDSSQKLIKPRTTSDVNSTLGPVIEELKPILRECPGCSKICSQRCTHTLRFKSIDGKRNQRRWEHTCQTCSMPLDPETMKVKAKTKSAYMLAKELHEKNGGPARPYWWNEGIENKKS